MKNLIIEIQCLKVENVELKNAQEKHQEINEFSLQRLHEKNNGNEQQMDTKKNQVNEVDAEGNGSSSNETQWSEN